MQPHELSQQLAERKSQALFRERVVVNSENKQVTRENHPVISFASNDYLGLAHHPSVIKATQQAIAEFGVHSGGSQLVSGYSHYHNKLEQALAAFTGFERCLLFSSGYMANLGVLGSLISTDDRVFHDRDNHASLLDGSRFNLAKCRRFRHMDYQHLESLLSNYNNHGRAIISDGVFSMSGHVCALDQLVAIKNKYKARLIIDDAHGFGFLGGNGAGILEHFNINPNELTLYTSSLAKCCASFGAFVAGDHDTIEYLIQTARTAIYSAALPAYAAAASYAALSIIQQESWRREKVLSLITLFKSGAQQLALPLVDSNTAIQSIILGPNELAMAVQQSLLEAGILVAAIRPPSVAKNESRLRISLTANHTELQINQLLDALSATFVKHASNQEI